MELNGSPTTRVAFTAATHVGAVRAENQDAFAVDGVVGQSCALVRSGERVLRPGAGWTAAVVDGMGGYAGGGLAALLTASALAERLRNLSVEDAEPAYAEVYEQVAGTVRDVAEGSAVLARMGATAAAVVVSDSRIVVTNVGDARVYRAWRGYLAQLSVDDRVSADDPALTQTLGALQRRAIDPHRLAIELAGPTTLLLCSDGLTDYVDEQRLREILTGSLEPEAAARDLLAAALDRGAPDNVTVLVVQVDVPERARETRP